MMLGRTDRDALAVLPVDDDRERRRLVASSLGGVDEEDDEEVSPSSLRWRRRNEGDTPEVDEPEVESEPEDEELGRFTLVWGWEESLSREFFLFIPPDEDEDGLWSIQSDMNQSKPKSSQVRWWESIPGEVCIFPLSSSLSSWLVDRAFFKGEVNWLLADHELRFKVRLLVTGSMLREVNTRGSFEEEDEEEGIEEEENRGLFTSETDDGV